MKIKIRTVPDCAKGSDSSSSCERKWVLQGLRIWLQKADGLCGVKDALPNKGNPIAALPVTKIGIPRW